MAAALIIQSASAFAHPFLAQASFSRNQSALASSRLRQLSDSKEPHLSPESRNRVRKAVAAVGLILVRNLGDNSSPRPRGSGVIVRSDGIIATNNHVITEKRSNSDYDEIFFAPSTDGSPAAQSKIFRLKTALVDRDNDLALLRVESGGADNAAQKLPPFPTVEMGDSKAAQLLDELVIIGFPEKGGTTVTLSQGVIEGKDILGNWIKTDARVIHGNSGGAAVNAEGKLIGIPTKVEADDQEIDRDGDGFPDAKRRYGAVGFLRPSHLVAAMIAQLGTPSASMRSDVMVQQSKAHAGVMIKGVVRSSVNSRPIAGALVGLVPTGTVTVTEANLLTWGSSSADGAYKLNKAVPPGKYTLKAKALGHTPYSRDVEIGPTGADIVIEMNITNSR